MLAAARIFIVFTHLIQINVMVYSKWDQELFYYFPGYEGQLCLYDSSSSTKSNYGDTYDKKRSPSKE